MNFLKRSIISIKRRKGKTIILFISILLVCNVIAGSISVKKALQNTEKNITNSMPIELKPVIDYDKLGSKDPVNLTEDIINKVGKSVYLKNYYYSFNYTLTSDNLESADGGMILYKDYYMGLDTTSKIRYDSEAYFTINGTNTNELKEIKNGKIKITSGTVYTKEDIDNGNNVIIISTELAQKNNLKVGSIITLHKKIEDYSTGELRVLKTISEDYKIVGIFEAETNKIKDTDGNVVNETNPLANYIYMPNKTVSIIHDKIVKAVTELNIEEYDNFNVTATYQLNSIDDLENFNNDNLKILPYAYKFEDNSSLYNNTLGPINSIEVISNYVMYAAILASILIIGLISLLFIRERKHEMGIYLALGEYKKNIAFQILFETVIISLLAVFISIFTGNLLASNISKNMLESKLSNSNNEEIYYDEYGYQTNYDTDEIMSDYNVNLDYTTVILIFLISIGSVTISSLIPIYYTLKINPKKILM